MKLSERVKACREAAGWSQVELAKRAGVSQQLVAAIERGRVTETRKLQRLAIAFSMTTDEFMEFVHADTESESQDLGAYIRECRRALGMTQVTVAEWIGVTKGAVSHWEQGRVAGIDSANFKRLSELLKFDDDHIRRFAIPDAHTELPLLPPSEMEVIHLYAALPENVRRHVRGIIEALSVSSREMAAMKAAYDATYQGAQDWMQKTIKGNRHEQEAGRRDSEAAFGGKGACVPDNRRSDGGEDYAEGSQGASGEGGRGIGQGGEADRDSPGDAEEEEEKNRQVVLNRGCSSCGGGLNEDLNCPECDSIYAIDKREAQ